MITVVLRAKSMLFLTIYTHCDIPAMFVQIVWNHFQNDPSLATV
jgi:hypothetical protein